MQENISSILLVLFHLACKKNYLIASGKITCDGHSLRIPVLCVDELSTQLGIMFLLLFLASRWI